MHGPLVERLVWEGVAKAADTIREAEREELADLTARATVGYVARWMATGSLDG